MKISAKTDYACRALVELCLNWPSKEPVQIQTIARKQGIPIKFLTHILINLKQLGYVDSVRGKNGGYVLRKAPSEIRLSDVLFNIGGPVFALSGVASREPGNVLDEVWKEIDGLVQARLNEITFEMLCDRMRSRQEALMFEI